MLAFLQTGRPASDPLNTTGVDMPPRGGNPAFSDNDLKNIVAYLRTIQQ
jgi:disulfide bond formation protein DsbB